MYLLEVVILLVSLWTLIWTSMVSLLLISTYIEFGTWLLTLSATCFSMLDLNDPIMY